MSRKQKKNWWLIGGAAAFLLKVLPGLLKAGKFTGPILSMIITIGAYAILFPLEFAIGLVAMIFIHELGHVIAAKQKGLPVSAPWFIPFVGALIAMKRHPRDAVTEAYVAIGGPVLGTLGAFACYLLGMRLQSPLLIVIANVGFFLNLLNLLPIHPLDGGRIATAVTRWLWLVGLIGGLIVIIKLESILFFIIWLLFAWDLGQKYIWGKGKGRIYRKPARFEIPIAHLAAMGFPLPGEHHRRDLPFLTYSDLDGSQKVEIYWESVGLHGRVVLPWQSLVQKVHVTNIEYIPKDVPEKMSVEVEIEAKMHENDRYYEVPMAARWAFGSAYAALAAFLSWMLYKIQGLVVNAIV